jgi:hypothetical protein
MVIRRVVEKSRVVLEEEIKITLDDIEYLLVSNREVENAVQSTI